MLRALFLLILGVLAGSGPAFAEPMPWLNLGRATLSAWKASTDPADPNALTLESAGGVATTRPAQVRILVTIPWPSSAYDTALTTVLQYFADHGRAAKFTVVNMDGNLARGEHALKAAQKDGYRLILAMGSESAQIAHETYRGGPLPVVTVCAKDPVLLGQLPVYEKGSGTNIAYTSLNMPTEAQLSYLLQLMPGLRNIAILVDESNRSAFDTQAVPLEAAARARGIAPLIVAVPGRKGVREQLPRKMAAAIEAMKASDPALARSMFWVTGSTAVFTEMGIVNANAGDVPVLSVVPDVVKSGEASAALAVGISFESNARLAAAYAGAILDARASPGQLRVGVVEPPDIAINFKKARAGRLRIPYAFFELASYVYDAEGNPTRVKGRDLLSAR